MSVVDSTLTARDVEDAARRIAGHVRETPVLSSGELSRRVGARVVLKAENLQVTGSFKARGAFNAITRLSRAELECGVVAASAGNHAQAVAFAAQKAGTSATLLMPAAAPVSKV
jgi:threonine dehydratase